MKYLLLLILFVSCNKIEQFTLEDKKYPKDVAIIETHIFLKDKSMYEYYSPNKEIISKNDIMSLIIIQDTLKANDYLSVNVFSLSHDNEMVYKVICMNKKQILVHDSCYTYSKQAFIKITQDLIN